MLINDRHIEIRSTLDPQGIKDNALGKEQNFS